MKYFLTIISSLALMSLVGAFATTPTSAAPALSGSSAAYLIPNPTSANGYVKPDDYD